MTLQDLRREATALVIFADDAGAITYVNKAFEAAFGWTLKELAGKPLTVIIPRRLHDAHHLGFSRFLSTGKPTLLGRPLKLMAVDKAGREFECEHTILAELEAGRWVFGAALRVPEVR